MLLCLTCNETPDVKQLNTTSIDPYYRMATWQLILARFWGQHKILFKLMKTSMIWFVIAITLSYIPETRNYSIYPLIISVLLITLREFIPLTPIPYGIHNTITSTSGKFTTASLITLSSLLILITLGSFLIFSEKLGNSVLKKKYKTNWDKPISWITSIIVIIPIIYISSLSVSDRFVDPLYN